MKKKTRKTVLFLIAILLTYGCAHKKSQSVTTPAVSPGPTQAEVFGPQPQEPTQEETQGMIGPMPPPTLQKAPEQEGYVIVLGPGLARAMAYVGVLKGIEENQIPIKAIIGVEMGALVGSIWGMANINTLEWEMYKLKRETVFDIPLLSFRSRIADGKKLYEFLERSLQSKDLKNARIPVYVSSVVTSSNELILENTGPAKDIIRGAMGIPGLLQSYVWDGRERMSSGMDQPFPVHAAKQLGLGKVLCIDVLGPGNNFTPKEPIEFHLAALMKTTAALAREQLRECDRVLSIPMDGISFLNFNARAELVFRGKTAVGKIIQ